MESRCSHGQRELPLRNGNIWKKFDSDMLKGLIKLIYSSLELQRQGFHLTAPTQCVHCITHQLWQDQDRYRGNLAFRKLLQAWCLRKSLIFQDPSRCLKKKIKKIPGLLLCLPMTNTSTKCMNPT